MHDQIERLAELNKEFALSAESQFEVLKMLSSGGTAFPMMLPGLFISGGEHEIRLDVWVSEQVPLFDVQIDVLEIFRPQGNPDHYRSDSQLIDSRQIQVLNPRKLEVFDAGVSHLKRRLFRAAVTARNGTWEVLLLVDTENGKLRHLLEVTGDYNLPKGVSQPKKFHQYGNLELPLVTGDDGHPKLSPLNDARLQNLGVGYRR